MAELSQVAHILCNCYCNFTVAEMGAPGTHTHTYARTHARTHAPCVLHPQMVPVWDLYDLQTPLYALPFGYWDLSPLI